MYSFELFIIKNIYIERHEKNNERNLKLSDIAIFDLIELKMKQKKSINSS